MKPLLLPFLFCLLALSSNAQDWSPISLEKSLYQSEASVLTDQPRISFAPGEVVNVDFVDSTSDSSGTLFRTQEFTGCNMFDANSSCFQAFETCQDVFQLPGLLHFDGVQWTSQNRKEDWLTLPSSDDSATLILSIDTVQYWAVFVAQTDTALFGEVDSARHYEIQTTDSMSQPVNNTWNGTTVVLSKTHGLLHTPSWYLFPSDYSSFSLIDQAGKGPLGGLSDNAISDYAIGDIIEVQEENETGDYEQWVSSYLTHSKNRITKQLEVTAIDSSGNSNKYTLSGLKNTKTWHYSRNNAYNIMDLDSITNQVESTTEVWDISSLSFENAQLKGNYAVRQNSLGWALDYVSVTHGAYPSDTCPLYQFIFEPWTHVSEEYMLGIGLLSSDYSHVTDFHGSYTTRYVDLIHYEGKSGSYGTPGWPIGIEESSPAKISFYPNPTENIVHVNSSRIIESYELMDASGRTLENREDFTGKTLTIGLDTYPKGIYWVRVLSANTPTVHKVVRF